MPTRTAWQLRSHSVVVSSSSPSNSQSVFTQIRSAEQYACLLIDRYRLVAAHLAAAIRDFVSLGFERGAHIGADAAFKSKSLARVAHAGGVTGFLHVHAEVDELRHHLRVRLCLV